MEERHRRSPCAALDQGGNLGPRAARASGAVSLVGLHSLAVLRLSLEKIKAQEPGMKGWNELSRGPDTSV